MIVSDDTVSKALAYLAEDPHALALAQKDVLFAEMAKDQVFARLYLLSEGTAKERESTVLLDTEYQLAKTSEIEAQFEQSRHKQRSKAAEDILDIWRTQNANARAAERVR